MPSHTGLIQTVSDEIMKHETDVSPIPSSLSKQPLEKQHGFDSILQLGQKAVQVETCKQSSISANDRAGSSLQFQQQQNTGIDWLQPALLLNCCMGGQRKPVIFGNKAILLLNLAAHQGDRTLVGGSIC